MEQEVTKGVLGTLGLDWKLFLGQLINFSIVVFAMWKFVYVPLIATMQKRSKDIAKGLKDTTLAKKRLEEGDIEKERIINEARGAGQKIIEDAQARAEAIRQEKLNLTKVEIEKIVAETKERIGVERESTFAALQNDIATLIAQATEKVSLHFDPKQQKQLIEEALEELKKAKVSA